jgi:hypothetical protein
MNKAFLPSLLLALAMTPAAPAMADGPLSTRSPAAQAQAFAADRTAILAMAGDYKVTFDLRETTSWRTDYTPISSKLSGGHEAVRVIEDTGRHIVLQHLLVVKTEAGKTMVIKHWRQDWTYEPESVLAYKGKGQWALEAVPPSMRAGRWSQTVWQTDDSPRYGGWGQWTDEGGVPRWRSSWTLRPLARRDAVRHPVYDRYLAINRHSPTPTGWIHWQDNLKQGLDPAGSGRIVPFVQETGLNSYVRDGKFDVAAADAYWAATKDYWAAIRAAWDEALARTQGLNVAEVAESGSASGERLMALADDLQAGKIKTSDAIARGRAVIAEVTR